MEKWIVIDSMGDTAQVCSTEKEAKELAGEWVIDGCSAEDIEIFKVLTKYKIKATVELIEQKPEEKK